MKRIISLFCVIILLFTFCACGQTNNNRAAKNGNTKTVSQVLTGSDNNTVSDTPSSKTAAPALSSTAATKEKCDYDLTTLNTTVAYSQVVNFWKTPKDYMGKIIKIRGTFKVITGNGRNYYSCNIGDATACCTAFLEFILKDDLKYPDEYPKAGDTITVMGEFETYVENSTTFCQLKNATFC